MLTCKEFLQELNEFLDETADQELRERLMTHVSECPNCFVIFDTTRKTLRVYKGLEAQEIPDDVHKRLMELIAKRCKCSGASGGGA
ncbi:MAG: zf-HC2 domain-containing protein [Acidobacteria bacterium]|nr:zf-HC2 domain-containing protein [Acidobacteriota bacterium]